MKQKTIGVTAAVFFCFISTTEAFMETLRAADSIGYSASVSGTYLSTELFPRLGLWEEIEPKTQRVVTERVASVVARGEVEIGFQAVAEILAIEGADYVGSIPDELQQVSTFLAVIADQAANSEDAERLIEFLSSEKKGSRRQRQAGHGPIPQRSGPRDKH